MTRSLEEAKDFWNSIEDYPSQIQSLFHRPGGRQLEKRIKKLVEPWMDVADIGCGPGYFLNAFGAARSITAFDRSERMLETAREKVARKDVSFIHQEIKNLPGPHQFDLVTCFNVMAPVNHLHATVMLNRVLATVKPGGALLLVLPSFEGWLYARTMKRFEAGLAGRETERAEAIQKAFVRSCGNPFGFVEFLGGLSIKHWLREEALALINTLGKLRKVSAFKVDMNWSDYSTSTWLPKTARPPWMHGFQIIKA